MFVSRVSLSVSLFFMYSLHPPESKLLWEQRTFSLFLYPKCSAQCLTQRVSTLKMLWHPLISLSLSGASMHLPSLPCLKFDSLSLPFLPLLLSICYQVLIIPLLKFPHSHNLLHALITTHANFTFPSPCHSSLFFILLPNFPCAILQSMGLLCSKPFNGSLLVTKFKFQAI